MPSKHASHYSPSALWRKIQGSAKTAGYGLLRKALILYYAADDPDTPTWARRAIYAALGYFIFPADAVPDVLPGGYADDASVVAAALATVAMHVTDSVKAKADRKLQDWF
jgi:uncharacterized membrane protein YkvA (DUF1232 family)